MYCLATEFRITLISSDNWIIELENRVVSKFGSYFKFFPLFASNIVILEILISGAKLNDL